jgi:hypothetical protein
MSVLGLDWIYPLLLCLLVSLLVSTGFSLTCLWDSLASALFSRRRRGERSLSSEVDRFDRGVVDVGAAADEESDDSPEEDEDDDATTVADWSFLDRRVPNPVAWTWRQRLQSLLPRQVTGRWAHRVAGTALFIPFALTAVTGGMYTVATSWLYLEKDQYKLLMYLHEGRYIEASGTVYVALLGTGVLVLSATGVWMLLARSACIAANTSARYAAVQSAAPSFASPSANTMARIHKAFDIDHADETEDESVAGSPPHAQ